MKYLFSDENLKSNYDKIKESIYDIKNISFYTIDENKKYNYLEPLLPLYISFPNYNQNIISFYLDINHSFNLKKNNIIIYKGYSKFPQDKEYEIFQWRKCYVLKAENEKYYKIKFKCFRNNSETKKLDLMKSIINSRYNNKKQDNKKIDDIIEIKEDYIKDNLIINDSNTN